MVKRRFIAVTVFLLLMLLMNACGAENQLIKNQTEITTPPAFSNQPNPTITKIPDADIITKALNPTSTESEESRDEWRKLPVLTSITMEAGTSLDVPDFFSPNAEGELTILTQLSEEELRTAGATYEVIVVYEGQEIPVEVMIVDTTAPTVEGVADFSVVVGDVISYKQGITLTDNANGDITLEIDRSSVDTSIPGDYQVTYLVTDASGNQTSVQATITVKDAAFAEKEKEVECLANELLAELITDTMSKWDITYQLWNWCRTKIAYSYSKGDRSSIVAGAYEGLHDRTGDCYAYYATFTYLLQKCEIETMEITRVGGNSNHWWNLVNLGDGWYHCDSSPRRKGDSYRCFMQTDAQVQAYTDSYPEHPNYYVFDETLYPERATTIIYGK